MAGGDLEHPGILYFYSESIALAANGCCAFVAALSNFGVLQHDTSTIGLWFLVVGGVIQLLCALRAYRAYDHFGSTAFAFYSAFWGVFGLEILLSTSIDLLHIFFVVTGILLTLVSPIINGFYPILLISITIASSLELGLRVNSSDALIVITAVSELCVAAVTCYGCVAALLHGIHERQVLPGFDDALIETVLWKRYALKSSYSDGKYANPAPLGNLCRSLGYAGLTYQIHESLKPAGLAIWLATIAVLFGFVSLLHNLRHERLRSVSSICDACLFAVAAATTTTTTTTSFDGSEGGEATVAFAVVRVFLFGFAIVEEFALMDIITFMLEVVSLFAISAALFIPKSSAVSIAAIIVGYVTCILATYNGVAELTNSVAQKVILPTGQVWNFNRSESPNPIDEEIGSSPSHRRDRFGRIGKRIKRLTLDMSSHSSSLLNTTIRSAIGEQWEGLVAKSKRKSKTNSMKYKNDNPDETDNEVPCPGDKKLMGKSDFQSPLFVMTVGTAVYSLLMTIGVITDSNGYVEAGVAILTSQSASLLISLSRGQTSYGFLSFTYLLESMILMNASYSSSDSTKTLVSIVMVLQVMWFVPSFHVFRLLSIATCTHVFALLFFATSGISGGISGLYLRYTSGFMFASTFLFNIITLGILLCSNKSNFCRWVLQSSAAETEGRCEMGFASNREEFDRCVEILRSGGVCCIPTDTVYCLACAANSPEAIQRIYDIKNRPSEKPLSLWLGSIDDIRSVAPEGKGWTSKLFAFMDAMWPGSVSLVVSRGSWLQRMGVGKAADLIGTDDSIALRVPNSTLTVALLKETGPLAITSANPSGACDCTHHNKVDDVIASKIDYILADGPSPMTIASSVIDIRNIDKNELHFYRVGCVPESYVWKKLQGLKEKTPPVLADMRNANIAVIQSFMSQIIHLIGCDTYKIHTLVSSMDKKDDLAVTSWHKVSSRVKGAFVSRVSFYDGADIASSEDEIDVESSEMIMPLLNSRGEVYAVLELLEKTSDGSKVRFNADDLRYSGIVAALLCENLLVVQSKKEISFDESVSVMTLTEHGLHTASARPDLRDSYQRNKSRSNSMRRLWKSSTM